MENIRISRRFFVGGALISINAAPLAAHGSPANGISLVSRGGEFFTADELTILNDVAEIMIPRTDTPGAQDAQVAAVLDAMMLTWAGQETQRIFSETLANFDNAARELSGRPYQGLTPEQRMNIVEAMDKAAFAENPDLSGHGYRQLKKLIFHVFYTSQTANADYVPIPGSYSGNLTLDEYETLIKERSYGG